MAFDGVNLLGNVHSDGAGIDESAVRRAERRALAWSWFNVITAFLYWGVLFWAAYQYGGNYGKVFCGIVGASVACSLLTAFFGNYLFPLDRYFRTCEVTAGSRYPELYDLVRQLSTHRRGGARTATILRGVRTQVLLSRKKLYVTEDFLNNVPEMETAVRRRLLPGPYFLPEVPRKGFTSVVGYPVLGLISQGGIEKSFAVGLSFLFVICGSIAKLVTWPREIIDYITTTAVEQARDARTAIWYDSVAPIRALIWFISDPKHDCFSRVTTTGIPKTLLSSVEKAVLESRERELDKLRIGANDDY